MFLPIFASRKHLPTSVPLKHIARLGARRMLIAGLAALIMWPGILGAARAQDIQQQAAPKVIVAKAALKDISDQANFVGRGEAIDATDIVARITGFLKERDASDGALVKKGQLLFKIEPDTFEATLNARKADLAKARASLNLARIQFNRTRDLVARNVAPIANEDQDRANRQVAEAQVQSAMAMVKQAQIDLGYTEIHAPFDGRLGRLQTSVGAVVNPNTPLVSLVREAPIYVSFPINEKLFVGIAKKTNGGKIGNNNARIKVHLLLPDGTPLEEAGQIAFVDNQIDPTTGAITVHAEFANSRGLIFDGAYLSVQISSSKPKPQIVIPQAAIQRDQQGPFVLLVTDEKTVEQRYVKTGNAIGTQIIILTGLEKGDEVITEGLQRVRPGIKVDPVVTTPAGK